MKGRKADMDYYYNPIIHKTPVGAVTAGETIEICFPLSSSLCPQELTLVLRAEGGTKSHRYRMSYLWGDADTNYYSLRFSIPNVGIYRYRFEALFDEGYHFIGRGEDMCACRGDWMPEWQLTVFKPQFVPVKSVDGGVIYHIFVDRFFRGKQLPFTKKGRLKAWSEPVDIQTESGEYFADDFYGGNLDGIREKLPYLRSLGVTTIYLSPIFSSFSNHRYDTADYMQIDDLVGTERGFCDFIADCREAGIGVILDGVFNHTGADSRYFNRFGTYAEAGAYQGEQSQYFDWFDFEEFPDKYNCWWGMTCVPTINKTSASFQNFLFGDGGVIDKWTSNGIAGWRLDVVDELPIDFTTRLCARVKAVSPDTAVIGEVWEDASTKVSYSEMRPYFLGGQLDGVMNYVFRSIILDYVLSINTAAQTAVRISDIVNNYPSYALNHSMTLLGSHDTVRVVTALSGVTSVGTTKAERRDMRLTTAERAIAITRQKQASALQYTLAGIPTVYYGDEIGLEGYEDPLNRLPFPWGEEQDNTLTEHYKQLGRLRREYADIFDGSLRATADSSGLLIIDRLCTADGDNTDRLTGYDSYRAAVQSSGVAPQGMTRDGYPMGNHTKKLRLVLNNTDMSVLYTTKGAIDVLRDVPFTSQMLKRGEYVLLYYDVC